MEKKCQRKKLMSVQLRRRRRQRLLFFLRSNWLLWRSPSQVSASERSDEDGGGQEVIHRSVSVCLPAVLRVLSSSCRVSEFEKKTKQKNQARADWGGAGRLICWLLF